MDVSEYRRRLQEEIEQAARDAPRARQLLRTSPPSPAEGARLAAAADQHDPANVMDSVQVLLDPGADPRQRVAALDLIVVEVSKRHDLIDLVIALLRDGSAPAPVRREALAVLRASSFRVTTFALKRPDYLEALRSVVEDPDIELRTQAIEVLAQEKDEYVQRRLMEGLQNPATALVAPEHAIGFLGYDIHAEHYPLLRDLVRTTADTAVKEQALRLLSSDPSSRDLFEQVLADKTQRAEVRAASAAALQALAPADFARIAAQIVRNSPEADRSRAATGGFHDPLAAHSTGEDPDLIERVRQLQSIASGELHRAFPPSPEQREE